MLQRLRCRRLIGLVAALLAACSGEIKVPAPARAVVELPDDPRLVRTLLGWQYQRTIGQLLGAKAAAAADPPADVSLNGLDAIATTQLALSPSALEQYERSARGAAAAGWLGLTPAEREARVGCRPSTVDDAACLATFIHRFGRRAFRRPLEADEVARYVALGQTAARGYQDFYKGAQWVVIALLQSPHFLYQVEPVSAGAQTVALNGYQVATRLSFFLLGQSPSDALLDAAERGELDTAQGVRAQALKLLALPEAAEALALFFDETFKLRELEALPKEVFAFPTFKPALQQAMRAETHALLDDIVWTRDADWREIVTADFTFVNAALATHYGLPPIVPDVWNRVPLEPGSLRAGLLGHASILSLTAHPSLSSPTHRGKFVLEKLLCTPIRPPPVGVSTEFPSQDPNKPPMNTAQRLAEHRNNPACSSCHTGMDGIGVGFENFDPIGRFRSTDNGLAIDARGTLDTGLHFEGPRELGVLLRDDPRFPACLSKTLLRVAAGRVETAADQALVEQLHQAFTAGGYRVRGLLAEIAASDALRTATVLEGNP